MECGGRGQRGGEDQAASSGSGSSMTAGKRGAASVGNGGTEDKGASLEAGPAPISRVAKRKVSPHIDLYNPYIICIKNE